MELKKPITQSYPLTWFDVEKTFQNKEYLPVAEF
jgi:hypothetical protein